MLPDRPLVARERRGVTMSTDTAPDPARRRWPLLSWAATDPGRSRAHNEDAFLDRPESGLFAVCDGAGGHDAGEVASGHVVRALAAIPDGQVQPETVRARLQEAHLALRREAAARGRGAIATTVVVLLASPARFDCLWAGDSRLYLLRQGRLRRITRDHSLVEQLVAEGRITAAAAAVHPHANIITRAVGTDAPELELDQAGAPLLPGDRLLLCSDGLTRAVEEAAIAALLGTEATDPARLLLNAALARGAADNVTALVAEA
jgi:protein phosphatase/serine/threonine-protein phosphatase Stp1